MGAVAGGHVLIAVRAPLHRIRVSVVGVDVRRVVRVRREGREGEGFGMVVVVAVAEALVGVGVGFACRVARHCDLSRVREFTTRALSSPPPLSYTSYRTDAGFFD